MEISTASVENSSIVVDFERDGEDAAGPNNGVADWKIKYDETFGRSGDFQICIFRS